MRNPNFHLWPCAPRWILKLHTLRKPHLFYRMGQHTSMINGAVFFSRGVELRSGTRLSPPQKFNIFRFWFFLTYAIKYRFCKIPPLGISISSNSLLKHFFFLEGSNLGPLTYYIYVRPFIGTTRFCKWLYSRGTLFKQVEGTLLSVHQMLMSPIDIRTYTYTYIYIHVEGDLGSFTNKYHISIHLENLICIITVVCPKQKKKWKLV